MPRPWWTLGLVGSSTRTMISSGKTCGASFKRKWFHTTRSRCKHGWISKLCLKWLLLQNVTTQLQDSKWINLLFFVPGGKRQERWAGSCGRRLESKACWEWCHQRSMAALEETCFLRWSHGRSSELYLKKNKSTVSVNAWDQTLAWLLSLPAECTPTAQAQASPCTLTSSCPTSPTMAARSRLIASFPGWRLGRALALLQWQSQEQAGQDSSVAGRKQHASPLTRRSSDDAAAFLSQRSSRCEDVRQEGRQRLDPQRQQGRDGRSDNSSSSSHRRSARIHICLVSRCSSRTAGCPTWWSWWLWPTARRRRPRTASVCSWWRTAWRASIKDASWRRSAWRLRYVDVFPSVF